MFGDLNNLYSSKTTRINSQNINQLHLAWKIDTPATVSHAPLLYNGKLYFTDWHGNAYAVDPANGNTIWKKQIEKAETSWMWHGLAGTGTIADGLLVEASVEGNAFGLDPENGDVKWQTHFTNIEYTGNLTELLHHEGLVYLGTSSVQEVMMPKLPLKQPTFRGSIMALDAKTGQKTWETYLVQPPDDAVACWSTFSLDPATNTLFCGTGNNYTGRGSELSDSVIAMDAKTGQIKWHTQAYAHDVFMVEPPEAREGEDYDFSGGPQLFEASINGQMRKLVGAANKSGFYFVFDRDNGDIVWSTFVNYGGDLGGMHAEASIADGRIYCWANDHFHASMQEPGKPKDHLMNVAALDAATGDRIWHVYRAQEPALRTPGHLANDVYLVPSMDGHIHGYHTQDGKHLWTSQPEAGAAASAMHVTDNAIYYGTGIPQPMGGPPGTAVLALTL